MTKIWDFKQLQKDYLETFKRLSIQRQKILPKLEAYYNKIETIQRQNGTPFTERKKLREEHNQKMLKYRKVQPPPSLYPDDIEYIERYGLETFIRIFKLYEAYDTPTKTIKSHNE